MPHIWLSPSSSTPYTPCTSIELPRQTHSPSILCYPTHSHSLLLPLASLPLPPLHLPNPIQTQEHSTNAHTSPQTLRAPTHLHLSWTSGSPCESTDRAPLHCTLCLTLPSMTPTPHHRSRRPELPMPSPHPIAHARLSLYPPIYPKLSMHSRYTPPALPTSRPLPASTLSHTPLRLESLPSSPHLIRQVLQLVLSSSQQQQLLLLELEWTMEPHSPPVQEQEQKEHQT